MFTLLGYQPAPWTPIDTLIVKGDMTQTLNFTDTPLVMELLYKSLGSGLTDAWFPVLPPNPPVTVRLRTLSWPGNISPNHSHSHALHHQFRGRSRPGDS